VIQEVLSPRAFLISLYPSTPLPLYPLLQGLSFLPLLQITGSVECALPFDGSEVLGFICKQLRLLWQGDKRRSGRSNALDKRDIYS
jgi:hypothetical protein